MMEVNFASSETSERCILGAIICNPQINAPKCLSSLSAEDFHNQVHRTIFEALSDMHDAAVGIDAASLWQYLSDLNGNTINNPKILEDLTSSYLTDSTVDVHIQILKSKSIIRQAQRTCIQTLEKLEDDPKNYTSTIETLASQSLALTINDQSTSWVNAKESMLEFAERQEFIFNHPGFTGITTGFPSLDQATTGLHEGELMIVAARPSVGKTAMALSMALNNLKNGKHVGMFSLEMSQFQLNQRFLSMMSGVDLQKLRSGLCDPIEKMSVFNSAMKFAEFNIRYYCHPCSISRIYALAKHGHKMQPFDILYIDYLQIIHLNNEKGKSRQQELGIVSRKLKMLAGELSIPVVAMAQLSRKADETTNGEPALYHLRESGDIEQDADQVLLLWKSDTGTHANLAKQRNGPTVKFDLHFNVSTTQYIEKIP